MTAGPTAEGVTLRGATLRDCDSLCRIQISAIRKLGVSHYTAAEVAAWSEGLNPKRYESSVANLHVVVAELNGQVVGFGSLDPTSGEVVAVYVEPKHARRGIGRALLKELLCGAKHCRLSEVHCKSSLCAESFYRDAGFEGDLRCKHRFRSGQEIDCVPMRKSL